VTQQYNMRKENLNMSSQREYETTDFYFASFLRASGYNLAGLRKSGNRTIFVFEDKPERSADVLAYHNGSVKIVPITLVSAIKEMKALIHSV